MAKSYDIIIIDHYDYSSDMLKQLSLYQHSVLIVLDDECNRGDLYADIIINPIKQAQKLPYNDVSPNTLKRIVPITKNENA